MKAMSFDDHLLFRDRGSPGDGSAHAAAPPPLHLHVCRYVCTTAPTRSSSFICTHLNQSEAACKPEPFDLSSGFMITGSPNSILFSSPTDYPPHATDGYLLGYVTHPGILAVVFFYKVSGM